ncbi:DMT family transporter [Maribellus maritimus]|uniref:DMT family transporter n=1 Tax=Maribellus maritimus TaxID=2870838 RepID=UPI001EEC1B07|nr:DMT family transporter [Maribellus maritimus]MCG6189493.1 DMT family transporter [Maribellus maritimus]
MNKEHRQGLFAVFFANTFFGLNIPVTKALMADWMTPMGYTATRMIFGTLVFWALGTFFKKEKVEKKDLIVMLLGGLIGYLGTQFLFSQSLEYTSPVIFALLMALTPVVVLILSAIFLQEVIPFQKVFGIGMSISGAALIILLGANGEANGSNNLLGIFFALFCVFAYSVYLVITRKISIKYQPVTIAKWMFLISAVVAMPFGIFEFQSQKIYTVETTGLAISLLVFALLFSSVLAFFLMPYALKRLEASTVSIFMNWQPIVASILGIIVGQDMLTWDKPLALFLVLVGVYLVTKRKYRKVKEKNRKLLLLPGNIKFRVRKHN